MIDLNTDVGESFGRYTLGDDEELIPLITSANIACGWHAGDPIVMEETVRLARGYGVDIGAHPSLPDLQGFGRRNMGITVEEAEAFTLYQIGALAAFTRALGAKLTHVKPHGALYTQAARDPAIAEAIASAVARYNRSLILVGLSGSYLVEAGRQAGLRVAREAFADRAYDERGFLRPRSHPGAVVEKPEAAAEQAVRIARDGLVITHTGATVEVEADTICLQGDTRTSLAVATAIRRALAEAGVAVRPISEIVGG